MVKTLIVHTVHGTWPNGPLGWRLWKPFRRLFHSSPNWYEKESDFCNEIEQKTSARLKIVPFEWDGKNSFTARARAASELRDHLNRWFLEENEAKHVIVAHSHGGTVAISATTNSFGTVLENDSANIDSIKSSLSGIITMATPFVAWRAFSMKKKGERVSLNVYRDIGNYISRYLSTTFIMYLFPLCLAIWWNFGFFKFALSFILLSYLNLFFTTRSRHESFRKLVATQPNEPKYLFPLIALRAPRDEASLSIALSLSLDFIVKKLWLYALYLLVAANVIIFTYVISTEGFFNLHTGAVASPLIDTWINICILFTFFWFLTHMLIAILMAVATGPEIINYSGFGEVQSEALPPATSAFVDMLSLADMEESQFRHSLHELDETRSRIAFWLDEIINESNVTQYNSNLVI